MFTPISFPRSCPFRILVKAFAFLIFFTFFNSWKVANGGCSCFFEALESNGSVLRCTGRVNAKLNEFESEEDFWKTRGTVILSFPDWFLIKFSSPFRENNPVSLAEEADKTLRYKLLYGKHLVAELIYRVFTAHCPSIFCDCVVAECNLREYIYKCNLAGLISLLTVLIIQPLSEASLSAVNLSWLAITALTVIKRIKNADFPQILLPETISWADMLTMFRQQICSQSIVGPVSRRSCVYVPQKQAIYILIPHHRWSGCDRVCYFKSYLFLPGFTPSAKWSTITMHDKIYIFTSTFASREYVYWTNSSSIAQFSSVRMQQPKTT